MGRRRRSPALPPATAAAIFAALAVVLLAAHLPLARSAGRHGHRSHADTQGHGGDRTSGGEVMAAAVAWPCCDNCGGCTKSIPPQCQCLDAMRGGCHPACRDCVKSSLAVDPPVYQCMDRVLNFCQRGCRAVAVAAH